MLKIMYIAASQWKHGKTFEVINNLRAQKYFLKNFDLISIGLCFLNYSMTYEDEVFHLMIL